MKLLYIMIILCIIGLSVYMIFFNCRCHMEQFVKDKLEEIRLKLVQVHPAAKKLKFKKGNESFTLNKSEVTLCLEDENGNYYNDNMLVYVGLHELAHALCDEIGHTDKFYAIFDKLMDKGEELGVYDRDIPIVQDYCKRTK